MVVNKHYVDAIATGLNYINTFNNPQQGDMYFNPADGCCYVYNNGWIKMTSGEPNPLTKKIEKFIELIK